MRHDAIGNELDPYLVRFHTFQVDTGDSGNTLERPYELAHQHVVGAGEVTIAGNAQPQDGLIRQIELEHIDAADIGRQLVADCLHALARLHRLDGHVLAPVEKDLDVRAALRGA